MLRDPALDVRAITIAGTGVVHCQAGRLLVRYLPTSSGRPTSRSAAAARTEVPMPIRSPTTCVPAETTRSASTSRRRSNPACRGKRSS
jgi:hypothetical protein